MTLHTLRHTALSRMIDKGYDEYTVMAISGHSSTRMLARYTHPSEERKTEALGSLTEVFGHKPVTIGERSFRRPVQPEGIVRKDWWTAGGSNSRPPRCERGALPAELAAHS